MLKSCNYDVLNLTLGQLCALISIVRRILSVIIITFEDFLESGFCVDLYDEIAIKDANLISNKLKKFSDDFSLR